MPKMPLIDLKALLSAERSDALSARTASKLSDERASALSYYMGDMSKDMPAPEGRSKAVSFDVADTIEGLMAPLMDIFAGGEEVVQFAPVGPEDVAAAEQETDYINHVFMQHNPGFLVLYSFIKDALLSKVGVVSLEFGGIEGAGYDPRPGLWFNAVAWSTLSPSLACLAAQAPPSCGLAGLSNLDLGWGSAAATSA